MQTNKAQKKFDFWWRFFERPRRILSGIPSKLSGKPLGITTEEINRDIEKYSGELVLTSPYEVAMLLTVIEDDDLYWLTLHWGVNPRQRVALYPYILHFTRLKKQLNPFEYWSLAADWERNGMTYEAGLKAARESGYDV